MDVIQGLKSIFKKGHEMQSFETKQEAVNWAIECGFDKLDHRTFTLNGPYVMGHGEMDRPDILVVKRKDGWSYTYKPYFFAGTMHCRKKERVNIYENQEICTESEMMGY